MGKSEPEAIDLDEVVEDNLSLIELSPDHLGRMLFFDEMADAASETFTEDDPLYLDEDGQMWLAITNVRRHLNKILDAIETLEDESVRDATSLYLESCLDDIYWEKNARQSYRRGIAWKMRDRIIVQAPFSFTLNHQLCNLKCSSAAWSPEAQGWIVAEMQTYSDLTEVFESFGVTASPYLDSVMDGLEEWEEILQSWADWAEELGYRIPDTFDTERKYKPHQITGILSMVGFRQVLLADQVGLGKSSEMIGSYLSIVQKKIEDGESSHEELWPLVIATNKSLKYEIAEEIVKWKSDAKVEILEGYDYTEFPEDTEFLVLNVDLLNKRLENLLDYDPKGLIIDEAHSMKNPDAKRTQSAQALSDYIWENYGEDALICMSTATPLSSRPSDLWSLLKLTHKEQIFVDHAREQIPQSEQWCRVRVKGGVRKVKMSDQRLFEKRWCNAFDNKYGDWFNFGSSHELELNQLLRDNVMVRRRKSDVMHPLPNLEEKIIPITLEGEQAENYARVANEFKDWLLEYAAEQAKIEGTSVKAAMRSAAAKLDFGNNEQMMQVSYLRQAVALAKIDYIVDWIDRFMDGDEEITGGDPTRNKLIVFCYHREVQDVLMNHPDLKKHGMVSIVGGKSPQAAVKAFQEDPRCRLSILYSGAREGLTMTAAKDVLIFEPPFLHTWVVQMAGRAWARFSELYEPHEATVWYAVGEDTFDIPIINKLYSRRARFNATIDHEGEDLAEIESMPDGDKSDMFSMFMEMPDKFKIAN